MAGKGPVGPAFYPRSIVPSVCFTPRFREQQTLHTLNYTIRGPGVKRNPTLVSFSVLPNPHRSSAAGGYQTCGAGYQTLAADPGLCGLVIRHYDAPTALGKPHRLNRNSRSQGKNLLSTGYIVSFK